MRHSRTRRHTRLLGAAVALTVVVGACGGGDDGDNSEPSPTDGVSVTEVPDDETNDDADAPEGTTSTYDTTTTADESEVAYDPDGVMRFAVLATGGVPIMPGSSITQFDPTQLSSPANAIHHMIYGTLLTHRPDGSFEPSLAASAEVVDPRTITIELRSGIQFSDGSPFDAEAVKFGLDRNFSSENGAAFQVTEFSAIDEVSVDGPLTVSIHFNDDVAGYFFRNLALGETMIVSKEAVEAGVDLQSNPVGAGAFVLEELEYERHILLERSPTYWNVDDVRIAGVEYVHAASVEAAVNAARTGAVDIIQSAPLQVQEELEGVEGILIERSINEVNRFWGMLCATTPPLDDVRVRQALNHALDRQQLIDFVFDGQGEPMDGGMHPVDGRMHDPELSGWYGLDTDRAGELLVEAGYPDGFELQVVVPAGGGDQVRFVELVQQQWAEIGVELEIVQSSDFVGDFFIENRYPLTFFLLAQYGINPLLRNFVDGAGLGNPCNFSHPELEDIVKEMRRVPEDSQEFVELWHQADRILVEEAPLIFGVFSVHADIVNEDRVAEHEYFLNFQGLPVVDPTTSAMSS